MDFFANSARCHLHLFSRIVNKGFVCSDGIWFRLYRFCKSVPLKSASVIRRLCLRIQHFVNLFLSQKLLALIDVVQVMADQVFIDFSKFRFQPVQLRYVAFDLFPAKALTRFQALRTGNQFVSLGDGDSVDKSDLADTFHEVGDVCLVDFAAVITYLYFSNFDFHGCGSFLF